MLVILSILNCNVFVHKELGPFGNKSWSRHGLRDCATALWFDNGFSPIRHF